MMPGGELSLESTLSLSVLSAAEWLDSTKEIQPQKLLGICLGNQVEAFIVEVTTRGETTPVHSLIFCLIYYPLTPNLIPQK